MAPPLPPNAHTLLLSAGPRAGKTSLLLKWREECPAPAHYLALTPEDRDPPFFRHRLLQAWPEVRARYAELEAEGLTPSWGGLLGLAIAETLPDFRLFLDDFQAMEDSPVEPELRTLFRHFPATGTLVIASRHQLPEIDREPVERWDADHPIWRERPDVSHLLQLPAPLLSKALALHLVGEAEPSPDGCELVRHNIASRAGSLLRLRPSWAEAAAGACSLLLPDELWDDVEAGLRGVLTRHMRTNRERDLPAILERVPTDVRRRRPLLLATEGDLLAEAGRIEEARACYERAIALSNDRTDLLLDLDIRLANLEVRAHDFSRADDLLARLPSSTEEPSLSRQAQILNAQGRLFWYTDEEKKAQAAWLGVLAIPASGERAIHYEHYVALIRLHIWFFNRGLASEASRYAERAIVLATEQDFQRDLLEAHLARIDSHLLDESNPPALLHFMKIPNKAFAYPDPVAFHVFLHSLGWRALLLKEYDLAVRYYLLLKQSALALQSAANIQFANMCLMDVYWVMRRFEEGRGVYEEIRRTPAFQAQQHHVRLFWAKILSSAGRHDEAEATLLEGLEGPLSDPLHAHTRFILLWVRHQRGDAGALAAIRALLETPEGTMLWQNEALLLHQLGIRSLPPQFRVHAFGPLTLARDESPGIRWPRQKALSLLAHLVLNPEGIDSTQLAAHLFSDSDPVDPSDSLHTVAYSLRQTLRSVGAGDLLESSRGFYRLKWKEVAFCDLHEFDAFYAKARGMEDEGMPTAAATFYRLALAIATGALFENLPDEFEDVRRAYRLRIQHAQAFLDAHHAPR